MMKNAKDWLKIPRAKKTRRYWERLNSHEMRQVNEWVLSGVWVFRGRF